MSTTAGKRSSVSGRERMPLSRPRAEGQATFLLTIAGCFAARNASRKGGNSRGGPAGFCPSPGALAVPHAIKAKPSTPAPIALLNLEIDRREVLMVAVGVDGVDAEQIEAGLFDLERHPRADASFRLEIEREAAFAHRFVDFGERLQFGLLYPGDEISHGHVLHVAVRIGVGEEELEHER